MEWFLVLMLWNPFFQEFHLAPGWDAPGSASHGSCDQKMMYAERYLPNAAADIEWTLDCVLAANMESAAAIVSGHPKGDNI